MKNTGNIILGISVLAGIGFSSCQSSSQQHRSTSGSVSSDTLKATVITEPVKHDSDDPAIWINPVDPAKSLIIGTDKDSDGGIYVFDLKGKIVKEIAGIHRPNNIDVAYGLPLNGQKVDIAVATERETNKIRIYALLEMTEIDGGGIEVFIGETERAPMGIALYTRASDQTIYAIVGRKSGPSGSYLWQYQLADGGNGKVTAKLVRKFGAYSGKKEIESIAVDNEWGYVYYSDEQVGVRQYEADPDKQQEEQLTIFAQDGFSEDNEGIAIYKTGEKTGYILVSNQGSNTLMVYPRELEAKAGQSRPLLAEIPVSARETDGVDASSVSLGEAFPKGLVVSMSTDKTFHLFDWREIEKRIKK